MPTARNIPGPYRFYFYSFDCNEPRHIHVQRDRLTCKFWLEPVILRENNGYTAKKLNRIRQMIQTNHIKIIEAWNEHCDQY
jgi:hypothetical protein